MAKCKGCDGKGTFWLVYTGGECDECGGSGEVPDVPAQHVTMSAGIPTAIPLDDTEPLWELGFPTAFDVSGSIYDGFLI